MTIQQFIAARRPDWQRLDGLTEHMRTSKVTGMSDDDIWSLGTLYRQATSDLAVARRDYASDSVTSYLNGLVSRAHSAIYRDEVNDLSRVAYFYRHTFPETFRRTAVFTMIAFAMTIIPAILCYIVTVTHPAAAYVLLPGTAGELMPIVQQHHLWFNSQSGSQSVMSSFIMTNNIKVVLTSFVGGALLGTLTIYVLVFNGIMLGTIAGLVQYYGLSLGLWSFIAGHGVIELSVIFIAGGCGLQVGWAIAHPGVVSRLESLRQVTKRAGVLAVGATPMLVVAGIIEGYLSPTGASVWIKLGVGGMSGILLYGYLLMSGRKTPRRSGIILTKV